MQAELSGERGLAAARMALASLEEHAVTPLPKHYEVWLTYHAQTHAQLRADIDKLVAQGRAVDDYVCATLHAQYLEAGSFEEKVRNAGETIASEIADVMSGLATASAHNQDFSRKLQSAHQQLAVDAKPETVRAVVAGMSAATADMARISARLQAQLNATTQEVSALRAQLEVAKAEAGTDALTGLANRKVFEEALSAALTSQTLRSPPVGLIIGDIDHFKQVNDTWGHQTGDQVIRFVASVMGKFAPEGSTVARLGGEEFALLMPGVSADRARAIAQSIRAAVEGKKLVRRSTNDDLGRITISLGMAMSLRGEVPESLVSRADTALYASKRGGRNQVTVAEAGSAKAA